MQLTSENMEESRSYSIGSLKRYRCLQVGGVMEEVTRGRRKVEENARRVNKAES